MEKFYYEFLLIIITHYSCQFHKDVEDVKSAPVLEESRLLKDDVDLSPSKGADPRPVKDVEGTGLKLGKDIEELKSKLNVLESKLSEVSLSFMTYLW